MTDETAVPEGQGSPEVDAFATRMPTPLEMGEGAERAGVVGELGTFGEYVLMSEIARGGMGVVYRAVQVRLNREVALKRILSGEFSNPAEIARFRAEAESAANLNHPNIVPIYEVGEIQGHHFFTMKLAEGGSLGARARELRQDPRAVARIVGQVSRAVDHAHRRGILHRDLKPHNILIDADGQPLVADFGLAKRLEADSGPTLSGAIVGTPAYMSPEQASGKRGAVTTSSDLYSIGAILYELLTGSPPFASNSVAETLHRVLNEEPQAPRSINPDVDRDLATIALKCLEKEPSRRYATVAALADDLDRWQRGEPIQARPSTALQRLGKWARRRPAIAALSAAIVLVVVFGTIGILWQWRTATANLSRALLAEKSLTTERDDLVRAKGELQAKTDDLTVALASSRKQEYISDMNLADRDWNDGNLNRFGEILDKYRPGILGREDVVGFEWNYFQRLRHLERMELVGHNEPVFHVAYRPDGREVATGGIDGTIRIWDPSTGRTLRTIVSGRTPISSLSYSPDGKRLLSADDDKTARVWDAATGREELVLKGHQDKVIDAVFRRDGKQIVTIAADTTIRFWDAGDGRQTSQIKDEALFLRSLALSLDGKRVATGTENGWFILWDVESGRQIANVGGFQRMVLCLSFRPDGKHVVAGSLDGQARVFDAATGKEVLKLKKDDQAIQAISYNSDGSQILAAVGQTVGAWDAETGEFLMSLRGHRGSVLDIACHPSESIIATASSDGTARLWDVRTAVEFVWLKPHGAWVSGIAFSPDGTHFATVGWDQRGWITDLATDRDALLLSGHKGVVTSVAYSPDGKRLVTGSWDKLARVWDAATGRESFTMAGHVDKINVVAFSPDGKTILTGSSDRTLSVWDATNGRELQRISNQIDSVSCLAIHPDGDLVAIDQGRDVRLLRLSQKQDVRLIEGHTSSLKSVAFSADGMKLATTSFDKTARIWNVADGREILRIKGHSDVVNAAIFTRDGKRLATASNDHSVRIWDLATGRELLQLKGHGQWATSLAFSPDGQRLVAGYFDGTVKVWDGRLPSQKNQELLPADKK